MNNMMEKQMVTTAPTGPNDFTTVLVQDGFSEFFKAAHEWQTKALAIRVADENDVVTMMLARRARLDLKALRVHSDKKRRSMKEASLRLGKAIDRAYGEIEAVIAPLEEYLTEQEEFAERLAQARSQALRVERAHLLTGLDWESHLDLAAFSPDQFLAFVQERRDLRELRLKRAQEEADARAKAVAEEKAVRVAAEAAARAEREAREMAEREVAYLRRAALQKEAAARALAEEAAAELARREAAPDRERLRLLAAELRAVIEKPLKLTSPHSRNAVETFKRQVEPLLQKLGENG